MSDEERIERLTQLANKAWPNADKLTVVHFDQVAGIEDSFNDDDGNDYTNEKLVVRHPNALDALEAALLVLNGPEALREFAYAVVEREGLVSEREVTLNRRLALIHEALVMDAGERGEWLRAAVANVLSGGCDNFDPGAWDHAEYPKMERDDG